MNVPAPDARVVRRACGSRGRPRAAAVLRGFTLVELSISALLLTVLVSLVTTFALTGSRAQTLAERMARVTEVTQESLARIQEELQTSVRLFTNDALGVAYLEVLDGSLMPPNASQALPTANLGGSVFEVETTSTGRTGNQLLFARYAWTTTFRTSSGNEYGVDVYRMVHYYLAEAGGGPTPENRGIGMNLCKFVSEPLVAGDQIDAIDDPADQAEVLEHLLLGTPDVQGVQHPVTNVVWMLGADPNVAGTFRQILSSGVLSQTTQSPRPSGPWRLFADERRSERDLLFFRRHSVATNYAQASAQIGRWSVRDDVMGGVGFPHGFEIQQVGPASARKVLVRLVAITTNMAGQRPIYSMQLITDCRDL